MSSSPKQPANEPLSEEVRITREVYSHFSVIAPMLAGTDDVDLIASYAHSSVIGLRESLPPHERKIPSMMIDLLRRAWVDDTLLPALQAGLESVRSLYLKLPEIYPIYPVNRRAQFIHSWCAAGMTQFRVLMDAVRIRMDDRRVEPYSSEQTKATTVKA